MVWTYWLGVILSSYLLSTHVLVDLFRQIDNEASSYFILY